MLEYLPLFTFALSVIGFMYLWILIDNLIFSERNERKRIQMEMSQHIKTIGDDLSLLTLRHKKLAFKQSRSIHLHLHDEGTKEIKTKGAGREALIPKGKH